MNLQETLRALADGKCVKDIGGVIRRISADGTFQVWSDITKSWISANYIGVPPCEIVPDPSKPEEPKYLLGDKKLDKLLRDGYAIKVIGLSYVEHYRYCGRLLRRDPVIGMWKVASDQWGEVDGAKYFAFCDNYLDPTKVADWQPIPSDEDEYVDMDKVWSYLSTRIRCICSQCNSIREAQIGKKVRTYDDVKILLDYGFCIKRGTGITNIYRKKENELQYWYSYRKAWDNFHDDYLPEGPWTIVEEPKEEKEEKKGYKFATSGDSISSPTSFAKTPDEKYAEGDKAIIEKYGFPDRPEWGKMSVELAALNRKICKEEVMEELKKKGVIK